MWRNVKLAAVFTYYLFDHEVDIVPYLIKWQMGFYWCACFCIYCLPLPFFALSYILYNYLPCLYSNSLSIHSGHIIYVFLSPVCLIIGAFKKMYRQYWKTEAMSVQKQTWTSVFFRQLGATFNLSALYSFTYQLWQTPKTFPFVVCINYILCCFRCRQNTCFISLSVLVNHYIIFCHTIMPIYCIICTYSSANTCRVQLPP